jgi:hypothetical protein
MYCSWYAVSQSTLQQTSSSILKLMSNSHSHLLTNRSPLLSSYTMENCNHSNVSSLFISINWYSVKQLLSPKNYVTNKSCYYSKSSTLWNLDPHNNIHSRERPFPIMIY